MKNEPICHLSPAQKENGKAYVKKNKIALIGLLTDSQKCLVRQEKDLNRRGALRSECTELTIKECRPSLGHLFFRFDLCLIRTKNNLFCPACLVITRAYAPAASQREDVSAYMGLNTAVNNSSAMTEHKYKQAVICEQQHRCTTFHSDTHLTSKYKYAPSHKTGHTETHTHRKYVHRKRTIIQTGASCGIPEFSKCLSAHKRGAKTTSGHMIRENQRSLQRKSKRYQMCVCKVYLEFRILSASSILKQWLQQQNTFPATKMYSFFFMHFVRDYF